MTDKPAAVHMIFIASTVDKVWAALTDGEVSKTYFFGSRVEVGPMGGAYRVPQPDGSQGVEGEVLEINPPRRLKVTWGVPTPENLPPSIVEFLVEQTGGAVRLTVHEYYGQEVPEKYIKAGRIGWALILSGMKTWLETGRSLPPVPMSPPT